MAEDLSGTLLNAPDVAAAAAAATAAAAAAAATSNDCLHLIPKRLSFFCQRIPRKRKFSWCCLFVLVLPTATGETEVWGEGGGCKPLTATMIIGNNRSRDEYGGYTVMPLSLPPLFATTPFWTSIKFSLFLVFVCPSIRTFFVFFRKIRGFNDGQRISSCIFSGIIHFLHHSLSCCRFIILFSTLDFPMH